MAIGHVALWSKEGEVYILSFVWLAANAIVLKEESHDQISFYFDIWSLLHYFKFVVVLLGLG